MQTVATHGRKSEIPDYCPHCHSFCRPTFLWSSPIENFESICTWKCPNDDCSKIIITQHAIKNIPDLLKIKRYVDASLFPKDWPQAIKELPSGFIENENSKFIKVFNESLDAETKGLTEIAGMGFRKALEHLVKDVAALKVKSEETDPKKQKIELDKIKDLQLWPVIDAYFKEDMKELLQKATWLGNDQSHYFKIYEEFDIPELKEIIELIVSDLDREIRKKRFLDLESRKQKPSK